MTVRTDGGFIVLPYKETGPGDEQFNPLSQFTRLAKWMDTEQTSLKYVNVHFL